MELYALHFETFGTYLGCSVDSERSYAMHLAILVKKQHYNLKLQVAFNQGEIPDLEVGRRNVHNNSVSLLLRSWSRLFPYVLDEGLPISEYNDQKLSRQLLFDGIRQFEVIKDPLQCIAKIWQDEQLVAVERVASWLQSGKYKCHNLHLHQMK